MSMNYKVSGKPQIPPAAFFFRAWKLTYQSFREDNKLLGMTLIQSIKENSWEGAWKNYVSNTQFVNNADDKDKGARRDNHRRSRSRSRKPAKGDAARAQNDAGRIRNLTKQLSDMRASRDNERREKGDKPQVFRDTWKDKKGKGKGQWKKKD